MVRAPIWVAVLAVASGCATVAPKLDDGRALLHDASASGFTLEDPLVLSDEARTRFKDSVGVDGTEVDRMRRLVRYLTDPHGLDFQYSSNATLSAEGAYRSRQGDCMAYSNLLTAAARELGVHTNFVYVSEVPIYYQHQGLFFVSSHIAVGVGEGTYQKVYDFVSEQTDWKLALYQRLSDGQALALYFNNLAVDQMLNGKDAEAERLLTFLVEREPVVKELYSNLGVVRMRRGDYKNALKILELGIERFPEYRPLYTNAVAAANRAGQPARAAELEKKGEDIAGKDPYFTFGQGLAAYQNEDYEHAAKQFDAASKALPNSVVVWAWLARAHLAGEHEREGREALRRLRELDPNHPLVSELEKLFSEPNKPQTK
ncbi:MAG: tetratricopeptide repeat protein [Myxococcaceae bacterium]